MINFITVAYVRTILSMLTVISHTGIILFIIYVILRKVKKISFIEKILKFFGRKSLLFAFIISLAATLGSLFFSEIALWEPCKLCWYQRIFIYPQTVLLGYALIRKDKKIFDYVIPLSIIGGLISAYHYFIQSLIPNAASACSATGVSCLIEYFKDYSYITPPMMALTAFTSIILLVIINKKFK
ncbi:MAG: disulfide oxidoreductase [archaeon]